MRSTRRDCAGVGSGGRFRAMLIIALLAASPAIGDGEARASAIFMMKVDGTEVRKVAQVEGYGGHGSPRFSHDDKRLVFDAGPGGVQTYRIFVVNVDGTGLQELGANAMPDLSPDDKQVAYHNYGENTQAGIYVQNLDGRGRVFLTEGGSPRWSPDGSQIAFTDWRTVQILDLAEGEQRTLVDERFEGYQIGFDWSPDGKRLAFVSKRNNKQELWIADTAAGTPQARVRLTRDISSHVGWSPDGKRLAFSEDGVLYTLEVDSAKAPERVPGQEGRSGDVAWSHDGKWLAFSSDRQAAGAARAAIKPVWKLAEGPRQRSGGPAYSIAPSSDGQWAVLGCYTGKAGFEVWDIGADQVTSHNFPGVFVALAPDNRTLAATGLSLKIQLIDLDSGELKRDLNLFGIVSSLRFSTDGTRLVSTTLHNRAQVWDVAKGKILCSFSKHEGVVFRAAFSPDGKEVMSVAQDKTLRVWDAATAVERLSIAHPEVVCGLAVTPDGRQVVTGTGGAVPKDPLGMTMEKGNDNAVRVWDLATGKLVREMKGHSHAVYAIDVSADGRLAVSGGWDGTIRVWDLQTGDELARAQGEGSVMDVKFSPDGKQVLVGGGATRFTGEPSRYFHAERVRLFELNQVEGGPAAAE